MKKKRGQNEGSISERSNGTFIAQITVDGKRVSKYFKTKREANVWRIDTLSKIQKGMFNVDTQILLSEYLEQWMVNSRRRVKPKTLIQYQQIIDQHINPYLGKYKLTDIRPNMVQSLYTKKEDMGIGGRTILLIHAVLHSALNQAQKEDLIYRNPLDAIKRPSFQKKEGKSMNETQVRSFLLACRGHRFEALFKIAVRNGLRQGELLGLKWNDLNWETNELFIQRQLQRLPGKGLLLVEPKTEKSKRIIVLGQDPMNALKIHKNQQYCQQQFAGEKWQENGLIFSSRNGTPYDPGALFKEYKRILEKADLPDFRFHNLRHTAISLMHKQGIPLKVVQESVGHSDESLTLNSYTHTTSDMQRIAAEKMDEITTLIEVELSAVPK